MAMNAVSDVGIGSSNRSTSRRGESKSYQPPILVKAAILSTVTAADSRVSGVQSDGSAQ
jgi:hypothetical protein